jgi:hypothetical protein
MLRKDNRIGIRSRRAVATARAATIINLISRNRKDVSVRLLLLFLALAGALPVAAQTTSPSQTVEQPDKGTPQPRYVTVQRKTGKPISGRLLQSGTNEITVEVDNTKVTIPTDSIVSISYNSDPVIPTTSTDAVEPPAYLAAARESIKALRKLASATDVGISYVNYGPLLIEAKTEVDSRMSSLPAGEIKVEIAAALQEYETAQDIWRQTWRDDFVSGGSEIGKLAVTRYGVQKKGWLKVVWRADILRAVWSSARYHFNRAEALVAHVGHPADLQPTEQPSYKAAAAIPNTPLVGTWLLAITLPNGQSVQATLTVYSEGNSGTLESFGNLARIDSLVMTGQEFVIRFSDLPKKKKAATGSLSGRLEGDRISGTLTADNQNIPSLSFSGLKKP